MQPDGNTQGIRLILDPYVMVPLKLSGEILLNGRQQSCRFPGEYRGNIVSALTGPCQVVLCYHQEYLIIEAGKIIQPDGVDPVLMFLKREGKGQLCIWLPGLGVAAFP